MTRNELIAILERNGVSKSSKDTLVKTYADTLSEKSLLSAIGGNRLQSGWKKAQFVIAKHDDSNKALDQYLEGWKAVVESYTDQVLCLEVADNDWKFFNYRGDEISIDNLFTTHGPSHSRQKIFYGSPGSGKSFEVKRILTSQAKKEHTYRTIFHPDSDYSTFVGSYKPVLKNRFPFMEGLLSIDDLAAILKERCDKGNNVNEAIMTFGIEYYKFFNGEIAAYSKKDIIKKALPETLSYDRELYKAVNLAPWIKDKCSSGNISYEFVPQAFTDAYVDAWKNPNENIYLVIEEINRGNCAQVFGDLFQLLDRNEEWVSEYPVTPDKDLLQYLSSGSVLGKNHEGIKDGKLMLPSNLYIYATMNTSDQSLFPMDSAFKRRWDWEYVPINPYNPQSQFTITIGEKKYDWSKFLIAANENVKIVSDSEDKQMGNFFIKNNVEKDEFISKVMFYLWSEVCKDEYHARSFFHYNDGNNDEFSFNELFQMDDNGVKKDIALLQGLMGFLGVPEKVDEDQ